MRKALVLSFVVYMLWAVPAGAAEAALEPPEPAAVALVEVDDLAAFGLALQTTLLEVHPRLMIPSPAAMVPANWLMTTNPASVDLSRPLQIVLTGAPPTARPVFVFTAPDPAVYLDSLRPDLREQDSTDGLHHYVQWPFERDLPEDASGLSQVFIGTVGSRVCLGRREADVESVRAMLEPGDLPADALPSGQAAAVVDVHGLLGKLKESGHDPFALMRQMARNAPGTHLRNQQQVQAQIDTLEELAAQTSRLFVNVALEPDVVHVAGSVEPILDSDFDSYLGSVPRERPALAARLPGDAFAAFAGQIGDMDILYEHWKDMTGLPGEELESAVRAWTDSAGPGVAFSLHATDAGPLAFAEVLELRNPEEARAQMETLVAEMPALLAAQTPGITIEFDYASEAATHDGVPIDRWSFTFEFEPQAGRPAAEQVVQAQRAGAEAFWGEALTMHTAFHEDLYLVAGGPDGLARLKQMIDGEADGGGAAEALERATGAMPEGAVMLGYLRLGEAVQWWMGVMRRVMRASSAPVEVPQFRFAPAPPIGVAGYVSDDWVAQVRLRVPTAAIASVTQGFMGGSVPGGQPPAGPRPEPVPMPPAEELPAQ
ncbi:MAG: hypothetical protein R6V05_14235 [Candidatus Brocadiia bacterium]